MEEQLKELQNQYREGLITLSERNTQLIQLALASTYKDLDEVSLRYNELREKAESLCCNGRVRYRPTTQTYVCRTCKMEVRAFLIRLVE